jgi:hypothetical protein
MGVSPVYSGQPLIFDGASRTFRKPDAAANTGAEKAAAKLYFALQDGLDTDVQSCGKITGFSALGDFEIETAWVDTNNLAIGDALMLADNAEDDLSHELVKHSGDASLIIGYVTDIRDLGVGGHVAMQELSGAPGAAGLSGALHSDLTDGDGNPVNVRGGVPGRVPEDSTSDPYIASSAVGATAKMQIVRFRCAAR